MSFTTPQVGGLKVMDTGVTVVNPTSTMNFTGSEVVTTPSVGQANVSITSGGGSFVANEHPTDNGDGTYTLAHTPVSGSVAVYKNGVRINGGAGNDYTISGAVVTRLDSYIAADVFTVDYRY